MQNTFEILSGFLRRYGVEVEGRETSTLLPAEMHGRLQAFARGELKQADQEILIQQLNEHPDWVAFLAKQVKGMRVSEEKKS